MYILIDKIDNKIKSFSEKPIIFDESKFFLKEIFDDNLEGYICYFKNNKIEKNKIMADDDKKKLFKDKIINVTTIKELKDIILELIN